MHRRTDCRAPDSMQPTSRNRALRPAGGGLRPRGPGARAGPGCKEHRSKQGPREGEPENTAGGLRVPTRLAFGPEGKAWGRPGIGSVDVLTQTCSARILLSCYSFLLGLGPGAKAQSGKWRQYLL